VVQRAVITQLCRVCGLRARTKAAMAEHTDQAHGERAPGRWAPAALARAKDQREFKPCLGQTPWGKELR
jgi:hypothetical protein